jgi:hypothetical protein
VQENKQLQKSPLIFYLLLLVIPLLGSHLLLLFFWWSALRWINFPLPAAAGITAAWCVSVFLVGAVYRKQIGRKIRKQTLLIRIPAALFFFSLLLFKAPAPFFLGIYALAFVPPYVAMMIQQYPHRHRVT